MKFLISTLYIIINAQTHFIKMWASEGKKWLLWSKSSFLQSQIPNHSFFGEELYVYVACNDFFFFFYMVEKLKIY